MYISSLFYFVLAQVCDHLQPLRTENFRVTLRCIVSKTHNKRRLAARNYDPVRQSGLSRKACAHPLQLGAALGTLGVKPDGVVEEKRASSFSSTFLFRELNPGHDAGKWTYR